MLLVRNTKDSRFYKQEGRWMYHICICDDEQEVLLQLSEKIKKELEKLEYPTPTRIAARNSEKQKGKVYTH